MLPIRNILVTNVLLFLRKMHKQSQNWSGVQYPLKTALFKDAISVVQSCAHIYNRLQLTLAKLKKHIPHKIFGQKQLARSEKNPIRPIPVPYLTNYDLWNLGQILENLIFCQLVFNKSSNLPILLHICDTYNYDYLPHTTFSYLRNRFYVKNRFPNFAFFTVKSPSVTQRSVSQGNSFEQSKNPSPFFCKTI